MLIIKVDLKFSCALLLALFLLLPNEFLLNGIYARQYFQVIIFVALIFLAGRIKIPKARVFLFWLYYFVAIIEGAVIHADIMPTIWFITTSIIPIIILYYGVCTPKSFDALMNFLIFLFFVCSISGIIETFTGINFFDIIKNVERYYSESLYIRFGLHRATAMMTGYTSYGVFLVFASAIIFFQMERHKFKKIYLMVYILVLVNELCTMTRSTILLCFAVNFMLFNRAGLIKKIKFWSKLFAAVAVVGLASTILVGDLLSAWLYNIYSMYLAWFDIETAARIASEFGANANGIGQRIELYGWVIEQVGNSYFFGKGPGTNFTYMVNMWFTKTSLENQYLNIYFHYGIVGLLSYIASYLSLLAYLHKKDKFYKEINFNSVLFWCLIMNGVGGFAYSQVDDVHIYSLMIGLAFAYNRIYQRNRSLGMEGGHVI